MSIFDGDNNPLNIPFPTMGGKVFWDTLEYQGGYVLQQNIVTQHCRILDENNIRVAWGEEGPMRAKLRELTKGNRPIHPQYGDVIGVHRIGGVYDHYGVYESDACVYEYAARDQDFGEADIHVTTLEKFVRDSGNCFILTFPEQHGTPGKLGISMTSTIVPGIPGGAFQTLMGALDALKKTSPYHLYSPSETIQRAKSRLGETKYNLITNNCEHYAIWCKTGIRESHQVEALLRLLENLPENHGLLLR